MQRVLILFICLVSASHGLFAQLAMGGAVRAPVPQSKRQLTAPHGATPRPAQTDSTRLAAAMQRLTPRQRKQVAKAMKKLKPAERAQVAQSIAQQLAAK